MGYGFTAQADDDYAVHVRIQGKARKHLLTHFRIGRHITAAGVKDDIHRAPYLTGHNPAGLTAAGTSGQNQNMIADAGTAFFASVTVKFHIICPPCPLHTHWRNPGECCGYSHAIPSRPAEYPARFPR